MAKNTSLHIENMTIKDILNTLGVPDNPLESIDINTISEKQYEIYMEIAALRTKLNMEGLHRLKTRDTFDIRMEMINKMLELESIIDKDLLVYSIYHDYADRERRGNQDSLDVFAVEFIDDIRRFLQNKDLVLLRDIRFPEDSHRAEVRTYLDFIDDKHQIKERDKQRRERKRLFDELSDKIDMKSFIHVLYPIDLRLLCHYPTLSSIIRSKLLINEQYGDVIIKRSQEGDQVINNFDEDTLFDYVRENIEYLDLEKMLLLSSQRQFTSCLVTEQPESVIEEFIREMKCIRDSFKKIGNQPIEIDWNSYIEIIMKNCSEAVVNQEYDETGKVKKISTTLDKIIEETEKMSKRYVNGHLRTQEEVDNIKAGTLAGNNGYNAFTPETYKKFGFSKEELLTIATHGINALDFFQQEGLLSDEDIEQVRSPKHLVQLYLQCNKSDSDEKEFNLYRKLFIDLFIANADDNQKDEIGNRIIEQDDELLDEEALKNLYEYGLITIRNYLDYVGPETISTSYWINLIEDGRIKPQDLRALYYNGTITNDILRQIVSDPDYSYAKKLTLIYTTFSQPDEGDREMVNDLVQAFTQGVESPVIPRPDRPRGGEHPLPEPVPEPGPDIHPVGENRSTYRPELKFNYLMTYDPDISVEVFDLDGHVKFYSPYYDLVIIEKLYDGQNADHSPKYSYGAATYFINGEDYRRNQGDIVIEAPRREHGVIVNKKGINRKQLVQMANNRLATRAIHNNWSTAIDTKINAYNRNVNGPRVTQEMLDRRETYAQQLEDTRVDI